MRAINDRPYKNVIFVCKWLKVSTLDIEEGEILF